MTQNQYKEIAVKYCVDDLPGSIIPGSRLSKILNQLESAEKHFSTYALHFLSDQGLLALLRYAKNELSYNEFLKHAEREKPTRRSATEIKATKEQDKREARKKVIAAKIKERQLKTAARELAFKNDPKNIARAKQSKLKKKYGLYFFIEEEYFSKLMNIIRRIDRNLRLSENDIVWLTTKGKEYFTQEIKECYHKNEADYHADKFKKDKNPWSAVNASSHYRKCYQSQKSLTILNRINLPKIRNKHLKSAICTTKGGSMRDLNKFQEALQLAQEAHSYDPKSFHPCTLLGAVYYEIGNLTEGNIWFHKAEKRGASVGSLDHELKSIFKRADKKKKEELKNHLLNLDFHRYHWVKERNSE